MFWFKVLGVCLKVWNQPLTAIVCNTWILRIIHIIYSTFLCFFILLMLPTFWLLHQLEVLKTITHLCTVISIWHMLCILLSFQHHIQLQVLKITTHLYTVMCIPICYAFYCDSGITFSCKFWILQHIYVQLCLHTTCYAFYFDSSITFT